MSKSFKIHLFFSLLYSLLIFFQIEGPLYMIFILIMTHIVVITIYEIYQQKERKRLMILRKRYQDIRLLNKKLKEDFINNNLVSKTYYFIDPSLIFFKIEDDDYIEQYKILFKEANPSISDLNWLINNDIK